MAAARSRVPVGSAPWVLAEEKETAVMISKEVEEFSFSVQNDLEWLNEHMAFNLAPGNLYVAGIQGVNKDIRLINKQERRRCFQNTWKATGQNTTNGEKTSWPGKSST
jgi:hypothetical protein